MSGSPAPTTLARRAVTAAAVLACALTLRVPAAVSIGADRERPDSAPDISAVVELFTSQGCSACPTADRLFETFVNRSDVIALSLPVDYWDYLGWKDTLASAKNTERQRAYAKARGDGAVYTPQIVVNGLAHAVGSDASQIERQIAKTSLAFAGARVPMRFWRTSSMMIVEVASAAEGATLGEATVWLAPVRGEIEVEIQRGENHGKAIKYLNVVSEMTPIGTWSGKPLRIQLASQPFMQPGNTRYAVLLQQGTGGPIIGAAWMGY